jgi:hypothetical protein
MAILWKHSLTDTTPLYHSYRWLKRMKKEKIVGIPNEEKNV